jgi:hypothetical protein
MTRAASFLGALVLAAACSSSSAGGATGGSSGAGGALGGSGGPTGGSGGRSGNGGSGGHTGGAGGHLATGGSTGGGASTGSGGAGGGAGQGAGGAGGFDCTGVSLDGDCSAYPTGLLCLLPGGGAATLCLCLPASGGPRWQCNAAGAPCPMTAGNGGDCSLSTITEITNFGGCKYPPSTICSCEAADGGAAWSCNSAACPATPPTGSCAGSLAAGLTCDYAGTSIACDCGTDGGVSRWRCNGRPTPDCPSSSPGNGADCSAFQPGTECSFPAGTVTGGPCTCGSSGTGLTWHCPNG